MMTLLAFLLVLMTGLTCAMMSAASLSRSERNIIPFAVLAHAAAAVSHVWTVRHVYGSGDITLYWHEGQALVSVLSHDPLLFWETVFRLIFQDESVRVPVTIYGIGTSTGTMAGVAAILAYLFPDSLDVACAFVSMAALLGKLLLYCSLRRVIPTNLWRPALLTVLMLPSSLFWSAGLLKEAIVLLPLGVAVTGIHDLVNRRTTRAFLLLLPGVIGVSLFKPYILLPLSIAGAAWLYVDVVYKRHGSFRFRPVVLACMMLVGFGGTAALGAFFPDYALTNLANETARLQEIGARIDGGSNYTLAPAPGGDIPQQLLLAPLALIAGLFRPFIFEARNAPMLLAAIETSFILALAARTLFNRPAIRTAARNSTIPALAFCVVFCLLMGVAVGLASTNLGTLSRYRMPMTPLLMMALVSLSSTGRKASILPRLQPRTP